MKTIVEQVFVNAMKCGEKSALLDGKKKLSFLQLCRQIIFSKGILEDQYHLKKGDMVILAADKQLAFASVYFACHMIGVIVVPIAPDTNERRFNLIFDQVKPNLVIGFANLKRDCKMIDLSDFDGDVPQYDYRELVFPDLDMVADIIFTTGTTGEPKGVQLTQRNIAAAARNINTFIGNTEKDVELIALPISHSFGLGRFRCAVSNGQTVVMLGSFVNIKRFFNFIEEYDVTGFGMVPASWAMIKKLSGERIKEYASQLHYIEIGSAPMAIEDKKLLLRILPDTRICMHYGLTEASRSAFMEFHQDRDHLDTIGKASPNMHIEIYDETGNTVPVGTEGEICVKGDAVTIGYYQLPQVNNESFWRDYFRTGDWGSIDKDNYIRLSSRKKELINVGGKKVSPLEVEEVLIKQPEIEDCACVAIPDINGILGEVVKAFVVVKNTAVIDKENLNYRLSLHLENYKLPAEYEIVNEIPKTSSGKIQRLLLKK